MRILTLGGTRFTGRELVKKLLSEGHSVTAISRRPEGCPPGAVVVPGEREEGIKKLAGRTFDVTLDFICYDAEGSREVFGSVEPGLYVLISSIWLAKLYPGCSADGPVHQLIPRKPSTMLDLTAKYLLGKAAAEGETLRFRADGAQATVLRLPIQWGIGDHTKRFEFYRQRFLDGHPVISVNGGHNLAQLAWNQDIVTTMAKWLDAGAGPSRSIWEALPDDGVPVRKILADIAVTLGVEPQLVDIQAQELSHKLPNYLEAEPLWREEHLAPAKHNLFREMDVETTPRDAWLRILASSELDGIDRTLREAELKLMSTASNA